MHHCRHVADACNHPLAAYELWLRTSVLDFQTGLQYLKRAAQQGHEPACLTLGKLLHDDDRVERDIAASVVWFERAAAAGSADAPGGIATLTNITQC